MPPFFSVIIPVYNKELYLERSILSVLSQNYENFELIIINDASTDNSIKKIKEFSDNRIKLLERDEPGPGGYAARNLGIKVSTGKWITFLDADDIWYKDHLENVYKTTKEYPDHSIISSARCLENKGETRLDRFSEKHQKNGHQIIDLYKYLYYSLKGMRAIGTNSICIKKEGLDSFSIFPEGKAARSGDLYAWVMLLAKFKEMVWSPHVASLLNRDSIGVSRSAVPSIALFQNMFFELEKTLSLKEKILLKQYANHMIKKAWIEQKRKKLKLKPYYKYALWKGDYLYCFKWSATLILPIFFLESVKRTIKRTV